MPVFEERNKDRRKNKKEDIIFDPEAFEPRLMVDLVWEIVRDRL